MNYRMQLGCGLDFVFTSSPRLPNRRTRETKHHQTTDPTPVRPIGNTCQIATSQSQSVKKLLGTTLDLQLYIRTTVILRYPQPLSQNAHKLSSSPGLSAQRMINDDAAASSSITTLPRGKDFSCPDTQRRTWVGDTFGACAFCNPAPQRQKSGTRAHRVLLVARRRRSPLRLIVVRVSPTTTLRQRQELLLCRGKREA